jgi:two-component system, response regulator PdtaR
MDQQTAPRPVVVVAEDEEFLRLAAADTLEEAGYQVIEAANADAALAIFQQRSDVSVLFTDIQMPGPLNGLELARLVHQRWPDVLFLITSGNAWPPQSAIPDDGRFLHKPYRAAQMVGEIDALVGKKT